MPKPLLEALSEPAGVGDIDVEFPRLKDAPGDFSSLLSAGEDAPAITEKMPRQGPPEKQ